MAAVVGRDAAAPLPEPRSKSTHSNQATQLLDMLTAAKPTISNGFAPGVGMPGGGDIRKPQGLYTYALIGPGVWPSESESQLNDTANQLSKLADEHEDASNTAKAQSDEVFSAYWTSGDGAAAAEEHYHKEHTLHENLIDAMRFVSRGYGRLSENFRSIKGKMRKAHDDAHDEIEQTLRANRGQPVGVGPIVTKYRTLIEDYSNELRGIVGDETTMLSNEFRLAPPEQGGERTSRGQLDEENRSAAKSADGKPGKNIRGQADQMGPSRSADSVDGGVSAPFTTLRGQDPEAWLRPPTSNQPSAPRMPSLPQLPSAPSGGSPLSGAASSGMGPLSGLMGTVNPTGGPASGLASSAGSAGNPAAVQQGSVGAMSSALGGEFGRGLAAGTNAASAAGPLGAQPVPQTPSAPLGVPPSGAAAPVSAAPVTASAPAAPLAAAPGSSMGVPASAAGPGASGGAAAPMTPYGSVLPPTAPSTGAAGSVPASLSPPPPSVTPGAGVGSGARAAGFVPGAVRESGPARVDRDISMTDLESARAVVADLAAASSAVDPGVQWAVAVARGASGMPEMWVTTNEGAGYIPRGVFVPRAMPLAAGLDPDFDARWFGWANPAETALRAVQARGDAVSAIATTWPQQSEEVRAAIEDVATGVPPSGGPREAQASTLTRGRSHRLETVNPALYHGLSLAEQPLIDAYVRQVTQLVAFDAGPELSATAQAVARTLIAGRWPSEPEWNALDREYDSARLMAGSQHPGLLGVEDPAQMLT